MRSPTSNLLAFNVIIVWVYISSKNVLQGPTALGKNSYLLWYINSASGGASLPQNFDPSCAHLLSQHHILYPDVKKEFGTHLYITYIGKYTIRERT